MIVANHAMPLPGKMTDSFGVYHGRPISDTRQFLEPGKVHAILKEICCQHIASLRKSLIQRTALTVLEDHGRSREPFGPSVVVHSEAVLPSFKLHPPTPGGNNRNPSKAEEKLENIIYR